MNKVLITRHPALVDLLVERGLIAADTEAFILATWRGIRRKLIPYHYMIHNEIIMENNELRCYCQKNTGPECIFDSRMRNPYDWKMDIFRSMDDD